MKNCGKIVIISKENVLFQIIWCEHKLLETSITSIRLNIEGSVSLVLNKL